MAENTTQARQQALALLKELEFLFEKYSDELRATTQPYILRRVAANVPGYTYHSDDILARETLMEHVGSLPVVATAFYPYIQDTRVDLGRALTMLAIHDIGELITGDENVFTKKADANVAEREGALKLLHASYHDLYDEVESRSTQSAKFAKAVDQITPVIIDYLMEPETTVRRYKHLMGVEADGIIELIAEYKKPYMSWNPFMTEFHKVLLEKLAAKLEKAT